MGGVNIKSGNEYISVSKLLNVNICTSKHEDYDLVKLVNNILTVKESNVVFELQCTNPPLDGAVVLLNGHCHDARMFDLLYINKHKW